MSKFIAAVLLATFGHGAIAQVKVNPYRQVDSVALQIPDSMTRSAAAIARYINKHFKTEDDKVRAAFIWVASSLSYDVPAMYTFRGKETPEDKIARPLNTRKGVCENYAAVFTDVCKRMGLHSYIITGYTKHNGEMSALAHAWCTVYTGKSWKLYDPTWASGYINKGVFTAKINDNFYNTPAEKFIAEHMPYDPMWQMLTQPLNSKEFIGDETGQGREHKYFAFADSIAAYERLTEDQQLITSARRIEENGVDNELVFNKLNRIKNDLDYKKNMEVFKKNTENVNLYNDAVADFNAGVKYFNSFVEFRNKEVIPTLAEKKVKAMIDSAGTRITAAQHKLKQVRPTGNITEEFLSSFGNNVNGLATKLNEQKEFLAEYLDKNKRGGTGMN